MSLPQPFVKVCGITRPEDALHAVAQGATALGFVFWPRSPRYVPPVVAAAIGAQLPAHIARVGVFVDETVEGIRAITATSGVGVVQLHGEEPPAYATALACPVIRSVTLMGGERLAGEWPPETLLLLDAHDPVRRGGTGARVDWPWAAALASRRRVVLAGGLTPENVGEAVAVVRPYGVDVSSGVEAAPGIKDVDKVTRFVAAARVALGRIDAEVQDTP